MLTSYISQHLMADERLIAITRIHKLVLVVPCIVTAFGLLLGLVGLLVGGSGIALLGLGVLIALIAGSAALALLVLRLTTEVSCTNSRILIKTGWLMTKLSEMPLAKVEFLLMQQGLFAKIFGYGTVVFKGSGGTTRVCKSIEAPFDFYRRVQEQVAAAQKHK
jgi:membrane protein YdbS with pleckstrin-like domain